MTKPVSRGTIGLQDDHLLFDRGTLARTNSAPLGPAGLAVLHGLPMQIKASKSAVKMVIAVNAKSQISAKDWVTKLHANKNIPDFIHSQVLEKNGNILLKNAKRFPIPKGTLSRAWLTDWLSAFVGNEWEITTGCLDFDVQKGDKVGPYLTVVHNPDLGKGETIGAFTKHTMTARARATNKLMVEKGNTLPNGVKLASGRKLIVIANRIALKLGSKVTMFAFEDNEMLEIFFHETACHAGRNTQGIPDIHGGKVVEACDRDIGDEFNNPTVTLDKVRVAIDTFLKP